MSRSIAAVSIASALVIFAACATFIPRISSAQTSAPAADTSSDATCPGASDEAHTKYAGTSKPATYTIPDPNDSEKTITITNLSKRSCTQPCPAGSVLKSIPGLCKAKDDCATSETCEGKTPELPPGTGTSGGTNTGGTGGATMPVISPDNMPPSGPTEPVAPSGTGGSTPTTPTPTPQNESLLQQAYSELFGPTPLSQSGGLVPNTGTNPEGILSPQISLPQNFASPLNSDISPTTISQPFGDITNQNRVDEGSTFNSGNPITTGCSGLGGTNCTQTGGVLSVGRDPGVLSSGEWTQYKQSNLIADAATELKTNFPIIVDNGENVKVLRGEDYGLSGNGMLYVTGNNLGSYQYPEATLFSGSKGLDEKIADTLQNGFTGYGVNGLTTNSFFNSTNPDTGRTLGQDVGALMANSAQGNGVLSRLGDTLSMFPSTVTVTTALAPTANSPADQFAVRDVASVDHPAPPPTVSEPIAVEIVPPPETVRPEPLPEPLPRPEIVASIAPTPIAAVPAPEQPAAEPPAPAKPAPAPESAAPAAPVPSTEPTTPTSVPTPVPKGEEPKPANPETATAAPGSAPAPGSVAPSGSTPAPSGGGAGSSAPSGQSGGGSPSPSGLPAPQLSIPPQLAQPSTQPNSNPLVAALPPSQQITNPIANTSSPISNPFPTPPVITTENPKAQPIAPSGGTNNPQPITIIAGNNPGQTTPTQQPASNQPQKNPPVASNNPTKTPGTSPSPSGAGSGSGTNGGGKGTGLGTGSGSGIGAGTNGTGSGASGSGQGNQVTQQNPPSASCTTMSCWAQKLGQSVKDAFASPGKTLADLFSVGSANATPAPVPQATLDQMKTDLNTFQRGLATFRQTLADGRSSGAQNKVIADGVAATDRLSKEVSDPNLKQQLQQYVQRSNALKNLYNQCVPAIQNPDLPISNGQGICLLIRGARGDSQVVENAGVSLSAQVQSYVSQTRVSAPGASTKPLGSPTGQVTKEAPSPIFPQNAPAAPPPLIRASGQPLVTAGPIAAPVKFESLVLTNAAPKQQTQSLLPNPLAAARARIATELQNPRVRQLLMASTEAEVGGQGSLVEEAYMESVINRAVARNHALQGELTNAYGVYYPDTTINKLGQTFSAVQQASLNGIISNVLAGSNVSNLATGNESGPRVCFGQCVSVTFNPGTGERFVLERGLENMPDSTWRDGMTAQLAQPGIQLPPSGFPSGAAFLNPAYKGGPIPPPSPNQLANLPSGLEKVAAADCASGAAGKPCAIDPATGNAASCSGDPAGCQAQLGKWAAQQRLCAAVAGACNGTIATFTATPNGAAPAPYQYKNFGNQIQGANQTVSNVVQNACAAVGVNCQYTSGYRDPSHNAAVGGASGSQHINANAIDFKVPPAQAAAVVNALRAALCNYNGCNGGIGYYGVNPDTGMAGLHVDVRGGKSIWGPDHTSNTIISGPIGDQQRAFANGQAPAPLMSQQPTYTLTDAAGNKVADNVALPPGAAANCGSSCQVDFATGPDGKIASNVPITPLPLTQDPNDPNKFTAPDDRPAQPPPVNPNRPLLTTTRVGTPYPSNYPGQQPYGQSPYGAQQSPQQPAQRPYPSQPFSQPLQQMQPAQTPITTPTPTLATNPANPTTTTTKPVITLIANPHSIAHGGTSVISWSTLGVNQCVIVLPGGFVMASSTNGTKVSPALAATTLVTAQCQTPTGGIIVATTSVIVK